MMNLYSERFIGVVKWFGNESKNINYGFISHPISGDYYFHAKDISKGTEIKKITENAVVIFELKKSQKNNKGLEASNITLLEDSVDLDFLFTQFIEVISLNGIYSTSRILVESIYRITKSRLSKLKDINLKKAYFEQFKVFFQDKIKSNDYQDVNVLKSLNSFCKYSFKEFIDEFEKTITEYFGSEKCHELWLKGILTNANINIISELFFKQNETERNNLLKKMSEDELVNLCYKFIQDIEDEINSINEDKLILVYNLINSNFKNKHDELLTNFLTVCPSYFKLSLWINGDIENLDFESYKTYVITLKPTDQVKFVKKTLKYIHENKVNISINQITSINLIDYNTSKQIEKFDNLNKLDYSTSIVLNTISELNKKIDLNGRQQISNAQNRIFDIILNQIKSPDDILEIKGYFDFCEGRCDAYRPKHTDEDGNIKYGAVKKHRNPDKKPELHLICDGRKAMKAGSPSIDENTDLEFWWCANQKCFEPSRKLHSSLEWEQYTLLDFLTILKIPFEEKDYEIYLNIINKANRFLKHLKCRECNHILRPKSKSNYAFYGITDFHCLNEKCSKLNERIYLSHCLNGMCDQLIDSRDSVKCKPEGFSADCGWYVCNYCHSCCSDEVINRRIYILKSTGQEYKCHTQSHRNLGVLSCNKCGHSMSENIIDPIEYNTNLNWLIEQCNNLALISNNGVNKFGKKWFILRQNSMSTNEYYKLLEKLQNCGFQIPDIKQNKSAQLVSEPLQISKKTSTLFRCLNCDNKLDLSLDKEKATIIKHFHKLIF